ncbi:MAG: diguanylate cyclase [Clostridia bacterium]|nr:diguanylate cyclase [Clostridia bacterium]MBQ5590576.1 diguanylate cyclase [Clostridia bacterium]
MNNFQVFRYLKKLLPIIVVLCVVATYAINFKLKSSNTYVASEVIHYNDPAAEQGVTPIGSKLDVNEIKSSAVMSKVVERMGLTGVYSVDSLISRVSITPLPDADKVAQKEAKLEEGEEYIYEPSTYIVSFTATNYEGSVFARTILDETLDVYFAEYSQKYVNVAPANNVIDNIESENYDYIELVELIDTGVDQTLSTLYQRMEQNPYYRATGTGVSFSDLADDFNYLRSVRLSSLFSKIYKYQITKNKTVLVSDYTTRIDNNSIQNTKEESIIKDTVGVINAYVEKMRESGNTNITYEYILDTVHDKNLLEVAPGDQTVTYDELIYSWRDHNESKEHLIIDTAYSHYIIDTFSACTGKCHNKECLSSSKTCTEIYNANYDKIKTEIDNEIKSLITDLSTLYNTTMKTNDEYNQYLGASYISVLSSASVKPSVNVGLYTIIAFFFLLILCCGGAIVLGRVNDIINYIFYTDHLTEFNNRAYFDKYLKSMEKKLLDDGTVYAMVDISNLIHINTEYNRQVGDDIIKIFTSFLKEAFGKTKADFIYNGNGSFVILIKDSDYITVEDILRIFSLRLNEREEYKNIRLEYKIGIAENFRENQTARMLLSEAIKNKKEFVSQII